MGTLLYRRMLLPLVAAVLLWLMTMALLVSAADFLATVKW